MKWTKNFLRHQSTVFNIAFFGVLLFSFFMISCSNQEQAKALDDNKSILVENRGGDCDIPE